MTRTVDVRFYVLRNNARFTELHAVNTPTLRMDSTASIKMSMTGEFIRNADVDWLSDTVQPTLVIDGEETPLGVLLPATVREVETETTKSVYCEFYDKCWQVQDSLVDRRRYYAAGTNYLSLIETFLVSAGITLVQKTATTSVLATAREDWDTGTSRLDIINQLLGEINYNPLWFNAAGVAVLEPASTPTADEIKHVFDATNVKSMIAPGLETELDLYNAPNVFTCICSNPDNSGRMQLTAKNTNPQSPLSTVRRKREIVEVEFVDNIADIYALGAYVRRKRDRSMLRGQKISIETALLPGFGVNDVSAINYGDTAGICLETAWEMELRTGGTMKHTLERVIIAL